MDRSIKQMIGEQENELDQILRYWTVNALDEKNGGFVGAIDGSGHVISKASKGAILNARILWSFSAAYNYTRKNKYLSMADLAYKYLVDFFIDKECGGVYWEVDDEGKIVNSRKQAYAQGFAIYGFTEYYRATNNKQSLILAQEIYSIIEQYYWDEKYGGYIEALSKHWHPLADMRLSEKEANWPKSMNTHLHILEPYTNLYRCWKDPALAQNIRRIIRIFLDKIIDNKTAHFNLLFDYDWTVKTSTISYGHDIEGSWLLFEAAEALGDQQLLDEMKVVAVRMVDVTSKEGTDKDSSLFYEKEGNHLDTDKHWWPQAEAMVGYINAWQITSKQRYLDETKRLWGFICGHIIDRKNGEWFWRVNKEGYPYQEDEKVGFWKCPYHNTRALIEVCSRLKASMDN